METIDSFRPTYQAFLESNLSARAFCKQIGIPESRFFYWQSRIRKEAAASNGGFLPVSINNHAGKVVLVGGAGQPKVRGPVMQPSYEISFPNGVTVRLCGDVPFATLKDLIMMGR